MARYLLEGLGATVGDLPSLLDDYGDALDSARRTLLAQVGDARRATVDDAIAQAEAAAAERFSAVRSGRRAPTATLAAEAEASLVHPAGAGDPEADAQSRLQGSLSLVLGESRLEALDAALRADADWAGLRRMQELRHPSTDHSWMTCLHAAHGPVLGADRYVDSMRLRLGVPFIPDGVACTLCGEALDRCGVHSQTCAQADATRGHYRVCHRVHLLASLGDPEAAPEPLGLIPSCPSLRPADILTSAATGSLAALDIGVCSPEAAGAGLDCCAAIGDVGALRGRATTGRRALPAHGVEQLGTGPLGDAGHAAEPRTRSGAAPRPPRLAAAPAPRSRRRLGGAPTALGGPAAPLSAARVRRRAIPRC